MDISDAQAVTPKQTLLLWAVIGAGGETMQKEMPYKIDAKDRKALEKIGLIDITYGLRRAVIITVNDAGWAWADKHLDASLPARPTKERPNGGPNTILQQWLTRLASYKQRTGVSLAELVGDMGEEGLYDDTHAVKSFTLNEAQEMTKQAYHLRISNASTGNCSLLELRADLPALDSELFDQAVLNMTAKDEAVLMRASNNYTLTAEEKDAGIYEGGETRHLVWIKP